MNFKESLQNVTKNAGGCTTLDMLQENIKTLKERMERRAKDGRNTYSGNVRLEEGLYGSESDAVEAINAVAKETGVSVRFWTNTYGAHWFEFSW